MCACVMKRTHVCIYIIVHIQNTEYRYTHSPFPELKNAKRNEAKNKQQRRRRRRKNASQWIQIQNDEMCFLAFFGAWCVRNAFAAATAPNRKIKYTTQLRMERNIFTRIAKPKWKEWNTHLTIQLDVPSMYWYSNVRGIVCRFFFYSFVPSSILRFSFLFFCRSHESNTIKQFRLAFFYAFLCALCDCCCCCFIGRCVWDEVYFWSLLAHSDVCACAWVYNCTCASVRAVRVSRCPYLCVCVVLLFTSHHHSLLLLLIHIFMEKCIKLLYRTRSR